MTSEYPDAMAAYLAELGNLDATTETLVREHGLAAVLESLHLYAVNEARSYAASGAPHGTQAHALIKQWDEMATILGESERSATRRRL